MRYENNKIVYEVGDWVMPIEKVSRWNKNNSFPARIINIDFNCANCTPKCESPTISVFVNTYRSPVFF